MRNEITWCQVFLGLSLFLTHMSYTVSNPTPDPNSATQAPLVDDQKGLNESLPRASYIMPPVATVGECRMTEDADILFIAGPNGTSAAIDIMNSLPRNFRSRDHLRVRYVMEACQDDVDRAFQGPRLFCNGSDEASAKYDKSYLHLVTQMRKAAEDLRKDRLVSNQVAVLFVDDQSIHSNRSEILRELASAQYSYLIEPIIVNLGVTVHSGFVDTMTWNKKNIITYSSQSASQSVRQILDRICEHANFSFGYIAPV